MVTARSTPGRPRVVLALAAVAAGLLSFGRLMPEMLERAEEIAAGAPVPVAAQA